MNTYLTNKITAHLDDAGYSDDEIKKGIAFADSEGFDDEDEALSLVLSRILYSTSQLADGARFGVEDGSW